MVLVYIYIYIYIYTRYNTFEQDISQILHFIFDLVEDSLNVTLFVFIIIKHIFIILVYIYIQDIIHLNRIFTNVTFHI